jgi:TolB-like protein
MSFFQELKRRNVVRVGLAYVLGAWVLLQIIDFALEVIGAPDWILQVFFLAALAGLGIALVVSWIYEVTPEGIKRESQIDRTQSIAPETGRKLDRAIIVFLSVAVVLLLLERFTGAPAGTEQSPALDTPVESVASKDSPEPASAEGPVTIAVLPFVNMSSDQEQEYFSDGITEEILNRLAGIRELQVAARTSAFSFKGQNQDVREIARMLGVSNILEGSVRKAGDQVRITAQLIRASDGFHLWSEAYDRKLENIFAIQDDIASQIAGALQVSLGISAAQSTRPFRTVNPEVYDLYLRARTLFRQRGAGVVEAIDLFEQALAIDPEFAPAWAGLAHSYNVVINYVSPEQAGRMGDVGSKSMAAAEKALELDPNLPTALHALGNNLFFALQWQQAEEYYQRALQLDPDSTDLMEDYSALLTYSWRIEKALQVANRMIELDPRVPIFLMNMANLQDMLGNFELRDRYVDQILEISPELGNAQTLKLFQLLQHEKYEEARRFAAGMNPETTSPAAAEITVDWFSGPRNEFTEEVKAAMSQYSSLLLLANRYDEWLEAVNADMAVWKEWAIGATMNLQAPIISPELTAKWRADPRSKTFLEELRLPEYWREVGWPAQCRPLPGDDFICQ